MSQEQFQKKKTKRNKNIKEGEESAIIGIIKVAKDDLKQRIINSYENVKKENKYFRGIENEKEIKMCEIFINDKKINFRYFIKFKKEGIYKIKYIFKKLVNSTNYMFYKCCSLISLDLSNFNTKNVSNMGFMFYNCSSLISLNLSNFYN